MTADRRHRRVTLRFYAELVDLLRVDHHQGTVTIDLELPTGVKDLVEACGVPHTEVDLILVDGSSVGFTHRVDHDDRVAVYPVFESFDIEPISRVGHSPLRVTRFLADNHLRKLARYLRLLGFDTVHDPELDDPGLVQLSVGEGRILLTRDRELLKHGAITHGYLVRSTDPRRQVVEVLRRFHLEERLQPFSRCLVCNGHLAAVAREEVGARLPSPHVPAPPYRRCTGCGRVYWRGSHHSRLWGLVESVTEALAGHPSGPARLAP